MDRGSHARRRLAPALALLALLAMAGCTGDFDQRLDEALRINPGGTSLGTVANPSKPTFVRGSVSVGGPVRNAGVVLRPILGDGGVNWDDNQALGSGVTFATGIFQVNVVDQDYRGPILVEVRAQGGGPGPTEGGNPATAVSKKFHPMLPGHVLYGVLPNYDGFSALDVVVSPFTTAAVMRSLAFDGSIAGVEGGIATGLFGLTCRQIAGFFAVPRVRAVQPADFANAGGFGDDLLQAYVLAALGQIAKNLGISNIFDFWLGVALDAYDDGVLNGSIGFIPGTPILMPDLSAGGVIGTALHDSYLDPNNLERLSGLPDNTQITPGSDLEALIAELDLPRDINLVAETYDFTLKVPDKIVLAAGEEHQTRIISTRQIPGKPEFHPLGDSAGPSFVSYQWVSSAPGVIDVQAYGRVTADASAAPGNYTLTLTVQPAAGQTFVTGDVLVFEIPVEVK